MVVDRIQILGVPVDVLDRCQAIDRIATWLDSPGGGLRHVVTVNPEFVIAARRNRRFRYVLRKSDLATADGVGIILAERVLGLPVGERITGVDLIEELAAAGHENARIFLLGAAEGVAQQAAERLRGQFPTVRIVGCYAGDPSPGGWPAIEAQLERARPTVLLVAFGHPNQDLWIANYTGRLAAHGILVAVGVGGAFDYLSGRVPRAPRLLRRFGLEWLYRLIRQPWRWRRQLALPYFVYLVLRERLRKDTSR